MKHAPGSLAAHAEAARRVRHAETRRALALALAAFAPAAMLGCAARGHRAARTGFERDPFSLGVASGFPTPDGVVLWTRLAPEPERSDGGMQPLPVAVGWEVSEDAGFARIARHGTVVTGPERAHAVHVEVAGLEPGREYWYRFRAGGGDNAATSPVGRTRTAPAPGARVARLRFAFASCQHWEQGYYGAHRHMHDDDPDLVVFLGDYIYESGTWREMVRRHWSPEPTTLEGYRLRYAQYKTDPDLQRLHAAAPWLLTWDDHEVLNDYAGELAPDRSPGFVERRAAAYRAYFEHQPMRGLAGVRARVLDGSDPASTRIYGSWAFGDLVRFHVLDTRQYRSPHACLVDGRGGGRLVPGCPGIDDAQRTMLGTAQERWLEAELRGSKARWNVLAQQTLFSAWDYQPGAGELRWTDGWSGYVAARTRLTDALQASGARNPMLIGGDVHMHIVADVHADFRRPDAPAVATEFCTTSITSRSWPQWRIRQMLGDNPHVRLADAEWRGYALATVERERCSVQLRVVDDEREPGTKVRTLARFVVEDGRPGALPA